MSALGLERWKRPAGRPSARSTHEEILLDALRTSPAPRNLGELLRVLESEGGDRTRCEAGRELAWNVRRRAALDPELPLTRLAHVFLEASPS